MPTNVNDKLISWASDIDPGTIRQAEKTARLPIVEGDVALMPEAYIGISATVGSVIPTKGAVIPAAVGVDIGWGMIATELDVAEPMLDRIGNAIPAGVSQGHDVAARNANVWLDSHKQATGLADKQAAKVTKQFGTLGSGNHFFKLCRWPATCGSTSGPTRWWTRSRRPTRTSIRSWPPHTEGEGSTRSAHSPPARS